MNILLFAKLDYFFDIDSLYDIDGFDFEPREINAKRNKDSGTAFIVLEYFVSHYGSFFFNIFFCVVFFLVFFLKLYRHDWNEVYFASL